MSAAKDSAAMLTFTLWMLASVGASVALRTPAPTVAAGVLGLMVRLVAARGHWTPGRGFGVANTLTLLRLGIVAALPSLFLLVPRVAFAGVVLAIFTLDGIDGWVAKKRREASPFGAAFDMETDALCVMVLGLIMWQHQLTGAWVLVAGLWRYVYATIVALVPSLSLSDAPRARWGRWIFCVLMSSFTAAFLPLPVLTPIFAAIGTIAVSFSFLYGLAQSRPVAAVTRSRAASDHERARDRAA
jgi:phosphatidylglycerophosphate synthase